MAGCDGHDVAMVLRWVVFPDFPGSKALDENQRVPHGKRYFTAKLKELQIGLSIDPMEFSWPAQLK